MVVATNLQGASMGKKLGAFALFVLFAAGGLYVALRADGEYLVVEGDATFYDTSIARDYGFQYRMYFSQYESNRQSEAEELVRLNGRLASSLDASHPDASYYADLLGLQADLLRWHATYGARAESQVNEFFTSAYGEEEANLLSSLRDGQLELRALHARIGQATELHDAMRTQAISIDDSLDALAARTIADLSDYSLVSNGLREVSAQYSSFFNAGAPLDHDSLGELEGALKLVVMEDVVKTQVQDPYALLASGYGTELDLVAAWVTQAEALGLAPALEIHGNAQDLFFCGRTATQTYCPGGGASQPVLHRLTASEAEGQGQPRLGFYMDLDAIESGSAAIRNGRSAEYRGSYVEARSLDGRHVERHDLPVIKEYSYVSMSLFQDLTWEGPVKVTVYLDAETPTQMFVGFLLEQTGLMV